MGLSSTVRGVQYGTEYGDLGTMSQWTWTTTTTTHKRQVQWTSIGEVRYFVQGIWGEREMNETTQYWVKWDNFPGSDGTWEDAANLEDATISLEEWDRLPKAG